jgi:hypothetical protein
MSTKKTKGSTNLKKKTTKTQKKPSKKKKPVKKKRPPLKQRVKGALGRVVKQEVWVKGKEPPKFYSFEKKFRGLYIIFLAYSFILIIGINDPQNAVVNLLMFGDPFTFGVAILMFFVILSFLLSIDKLRIFIFEGNTLIKQTVFYIGLIAGIYLFLIFFIGTNFNFITYLLILSMIWLFLLSSRFYMNARKFSTKIESNFIKKYSRTRYGVALIVPFFVLGLLIIVSLFYRSVLVYLALDFFGPSSPVNAVAVYNTEMRLIMPLIYLSLVLTLLFIIFEFVFTRSRAETKRAGGFDNFTFALIVMFIFAFQIFQITIFLLLRPETIATIKDAFGAGGTATVTYIFLFEFILSMIFLLRIIKKLGTTLGWGILIWKKDGMILFFLGCVFAQTLTRYALTTQVANQELTLAGDIMLLDRYIVSVLMIALLGLTLLVYYLKPHETSMFMRLQRETVSGEDKSMEIIYKLIRSEYIRRGEPFPVNILERDMIKSTQLSKGLVYSLLKRLSDRDMNIDLLEKRDAKGKRVKFVEFLSITEQFEKKKVAEKKAKEYLSKRLVDTMAKEKRSTQISTKDLKKGKATDQFISSLATGYSKKQKAIQEEKKATEAKTSTLFKIEVLSEEIRSQVKSVIKKEYLFRLEHTEKYPEIYIPISQLSTAITGATKISNVHGILDELAKRDVEIELLKNREMPEDKKIKLFPIHDFHVSSSLEHFRPELYDKFRIALFKTLVRNLKLKKTSSVISKLKRSMPKQNEKQIATVDLLTMLYNYYTEYDKQLKSIPDKPKMIRLLKAWGDTLSKKKPSTLKTTKDTMKKEKSKKK